MNPANLVSNVAVILAHMAPSMFSAFAKIETLVMT